MQSPTATEIREELLQAVRLDLLGPAGGPEEEVDEARIRDRYLVGTLAPRRQELSPEQFDESVVTSTGTAEEGKADYTAPPAMTMFPSSLGMTFCIDLHAEAFQVTARWGQYRRVPSETLETQSGEYKTIWKRIPREGTSAPIPLKPGRLDDWQPDSECPEVSVQGIARKRDDHWSVTLFLVNGQNEPKKSRDQAWLFQPELMVEAPDGQAIFHRRATRRTPGKSDSMTYAEDQEMAMLYRHQVEFAVGHGVSVHAETLEETPDRAVRIRTEVIPTYEVPKVTPPTVADIPSLDGLVLDMWELAETATADFASKLIPLASAYEEWIAEQEANIGTPDTEIFADAAETALERCRDALQRIKAGIALICENEQAADAFRFANRAMWRQRIQFLYDLQRRRNENADMASIDVGKNRSWYPFQLAFMLLNLPGITQLDHPDRSHENHATADLLWFSTGGGKTEAYLGLSAYTMALRRLQGTVAGRSGEHGVAVLMRYTLRLLTIQQFQRASALICACEVIRREALDKGDTRWGETPFRIGLWVGQKTTPNTTEQSAQAMTQTQGFPQRLGAVGGSGSPAQLTNCSWCGEPIKPGPPDIKVESYNQGQGRTLIFCGDHLGRCPFSPAQAPGEGLPVLVVDEEIYRRLPTLLIATVDKFAQMPWNGKVQMLFGKVNGYCERHGFRSPELEDADSHPKRGSLSAAKTVAHPPVRPPDLIIQDELHLISGPLGTLVGLYETAVDRLCSWEVDGKIVRPKVVASTATIRRASDQMHATFMRQVSVFPPQGLDIRDNFFSLQRPPDDTHPGRLYLGLCAPGRRMKVALIRAYVAFLAAGQQLYEKYGKAADPWMTLLGYFNSMQELGSMRRLVDDDVRTRLGKMDQRGLAKRSLTSIDELTSRKGSTDLPVVLDQLEVPFDPTTEARRKATKGAGKGLPPRPLDVLLATNMVSVGVDVQRLGLMVVAGQPKTTAEYIQASSRIGRQFPGLVCMVYNWARPRDLSHYETFEHYHATFYKHVEALSVTPFAPGALERGLTALLVALIRLQGNEFNDNHGACRIDRHHPYVKEAIDIIVHRAHAVGNGKAVAEHIRAVLNERIDEWLAKAQRTAGGGTLGYDKRDGLTVSLLSRPGTEPWDRFTCLNSLRDVEPTVGLILQDGGLDEVSVATPAGGNQDRSEEGAHA